jgi:hypothetical protein
MHAPSKEPKADDHRLTAFQTLLDGSRDATEQKVEMTTLRKVCAGGESYCHLCSRI